MKQRKLLELLSLKMTNLVSKNNNAIIVNLFGGPGCGKSTAAAYIFSKLKMSGVNCELVTEFAKDITWEKNNRALACQPYVFGKQCYRIDRCVDQVDVIITDSPLVLTTLYNHDEDIEPEFTQMVLKKFNEFDNFNFLLSRKKPYMKIGRSQTEEEAKELDAKITSVLNNFNIKYEIIDGSIEGCEEIIYRVKKKLEVERRCV